MLVLTIAVALVGLLCLLDLVLTLGVVRRLREHAEVLANLPGQGGAEPPVGAAVGPFAARAVDGERVTQDHLVDQTLVAFFSPGCAPCEELRPAFVRFAAAHPGGRGQVLAVLTAPAELDSGEHADAVAELAPVARVVVQEQGDEVVAAAFGVRRYPTLCLVDANGRIAASGSSLTSLRAPVPV
jgi:thiol-disulfide isomerase/thioredoxin